MKKFLIASLIGSSLFGYQYHLSINSMLITDDFGNLYKEREVKKIKPTYYNVLPYLGYIDYSGSTNKDNGIVGGIYLSATQSPWTTELDVEHTNIKHNDGSDDLRQSDYTMIIHHAENNIAIKGGMHYINSTDDLTDGGKVLIGSIGYYRAYKCNVGMDVYYSDYSNLSTSPTILQFSPKMGVDFGDYYSKVGSFYAQAKIDFIKPLKNKSANNLSSSYTSIEGTLNNYKGRFTTSLSAWVGKRSFAVENSGFIVNNLADEQKGGFKVSENVRLTSKDSVRLEYSYTKLTDYDTKTIVASYNYKF